MMTRFKACCHSCSTKARLLKQTSTPEHIQNVVWVTESSDTRAESGPLPASGNSGPNRTLPSAEQTHFQVDNCAKPIQQHMPCFQWCASTALTPYARPNGRPRSCRPDAVRLNYLQLGTTRSLLSLSLLPAVGAAQLIFFHTAIAATRPLFVPDRARLPKNMS